MKFGTSGLRGLVSDMNDAVCAEYTVAFLIHLANDGCQPAAVLVGRDLRPSSPRIVAACRAAIQAAGIMAVDCGVLPTPALALAASVRGLPAIMVTGSHIPFDRNGLKFYRPEGEITKDDEIGILGALGRQLPAAAAMAPLVSDDTARALYLQRAQAFPAHCLTGLRVGVYQHSAAGRDLLVTALSRLGASSVALGRSDAFVPIDTEAVSEADHLLAAGWTRAHGLDALVTTDGDGDRPLIADEHGTFLRGDAVGVLTARFLDADAVATPISSTSILERSGWFARTARTRIGSPHVIAAMTRLAAEGARLPVGFEANGGFLLGGAATLPTGGTLPALPTRDALLPILATLCLAAQRAQPVSALVSALPARATASQRLTGVPVKASGPFLEALIGDAMAQASLLAALDGPVVTGVDTTDGVRLTLAGDEVVHLRASGNAPELRCYAEAADAGRAEALVTVLLAAAATAIGPLDGYAAARGTA